MKTTTITASMVKSQQEHFFLFLFVCVCVCVCVCVLATPGSMWDLSSPTRNQTQAPCLGSLESQLQQQEHLDLHNRLSLYLQN